MATPSGYSRAAWNVSTIIDSWMYRIHGCRERRDHREALRAIQSLRTHLASLRSELRREALDLYHERKETTHV